MKSELDKYRLDYELNAYEIPYMAYMAVIRTQVQILLKHVSKGLRKSSR